MFRLLIGLSCCVIASGCGSDAANTPRGGDSSGAGGTASQGSGGVHGGAGGQGSAGNSLGSSGSGGKTSGTAGIAPATGGSGGIAAASGGSGAATGGTGATTGGAGGTASPSTCETPTPGACSAPEVRITEVDVGANVVVNEDDAALKMLSISPVPSGGSRLAWMGGDSQVHITTLGCDDQVVDSFGLPAMDYGDIYADDKGGVLLVSRDAQGGGTLNCGTPSNLCGTPPSPAIPCYDMYMVRFDDKSETWATKLSVSSATLPPYSTGPMGAQTYFVWWYAHHGRLAFDGTNWAGYYGSATSVSQACTSGGNTAINIHQGDEMRVVSPSGAIIPGGFDWGCSHSGFEKIVWDPMAKHFAMICRSDGFPHEGLNVNASKLVNAISATDSSVSNIVLSATPNSYWTLVTNSGALHLFQFTTAGGMTSDVSLGNGDKPHLVTYGSHLLAAWAPAATGNMVGQLLDAATGAKIGDSFPIDVPSNQFQDFRDYSDGSVAYPAPGSGPSKIKIVRVMPCSG